MEAEDHTKGEMGTINLNTLEEEAPNAVTAGAFDADIVACAACCSQSHAGLPP